MWLLPFSTDRFDVLVAAGHTVWAGAVEERTLRLEERHLTTVLGGMTADLDLLLEPLDNTRQEIIDGESSVSRPRSGVAGIAGRRFSVPSRQRRRRCWPARSSRDRRRRMLGADGTLQGAPALAAALTVVRLSPGSVNEYRNLVAERQLYARQGLVSIGRWTGSSGRCRCCGAKNRPAPWKPSSPSR